MAIMGRLLRSAREEAGLTQAQVAARMGWKRGRLSHYENGRTNIDALHLMLLASMYGTTVGAILGEEDQLPQLQAENAHLRSLLLELMSIIDAGLSHRETITTADSVENSPADVTVIG